MYFSVIIPAYNEEENIPVLTERVSSVLNRTGKEWEMIVIDDGSTDHTFEALLEARKANPRIRIIRFRRNFGQSLSWQAGFDHAKGEIIISMDADLQNDPEDIPAMVAMLEEKNYDVVTGWRKDRQDKWIMIQLSALGNWLRMFLTGDRTHDHGCSLKVYRAFCIRDIDFYSDLHRRYITALLHWRGYRVGEMSVRHHPRKRGTSHYNIRKKWKGLLDLLVVRFWVQYSTRPIHLFGTIGVMLIGAGGILGGTLGVLRYLEIISLQNRTSPLLAVFLVIVGVQFFMTGFLADFVSKSYYTSRKAYVIDRTEGISD